MSSNEEPEKSSMPSPPVDEFMNLLGSLYAANETKYEIYACELLKNGQLSFKINEVLFSYRIVNRKCEFRTSIDDGFNSFFNASIPMPRKINEKIETLKFEFARGEASLRT